MRRGKGGRSRAVTGPTRTRGDEAATDSLNMLRNVSDPYARG